MVTTKSNLVAAHDNSPLELKDRLDSAAVHAPVRAVAAVAEVADSGFDADGDAILLCPVPSSAVIHDVLLQLDSFDASTDSVVNVGVYNGQDAFKDGSTLYAAEALIDEDALAAGSTVVRSANAVPVSVLGFGKDIANSNKRLYDLCGLAADPHRTFYVGLTQTATVSDDDGAGTIRMTVLYSDA